MVKPNKKWLKINYTLINNGVQTYSFNFTVELLSDIEKLWLYMKFRAPQDENDKHYQRVFFNTVFEADKVVQGIQNNMMVRRFAQSILDVSNFEWKFPLKKVKNLKKIERFIYLNFFI